MEWRAAAILVLRGALGSKAQQLVNLSFLPLPPINMGNGCCSVVTADLNGDGKADIAIAYGIEAITVLLSNGKSSFTRNDTALDLGAGVILKGLVASADFNGDHIPDLVGITEDPADPSRFFRSEVLLGLGNDSFRAPILVGPYGSKAVADFNRDGKLDLLVHCAGDNCPFAVLLGKRRRHVQPPGPVTQQPAGDFTWAVVADFNGDGKPDVVETTFRMGYTPYVYQWLGKGDGSFAGPMITRLAGDVTSSQLVAGDFNGDGHPDLAVLVDSGVLGHACGIEILLGDATGNFSVGNTYPITFTLPLTISELQHSGGLDLAAGFTVLPGHGDGTFGMAQSFGQYGPLLTPSGLSLATSQPGGYVGPQLATSRGTGGLGW